MSKCDAEPRLMFELRTNLIWNFPPFISDQRYSNVSKRSPNQPAYYTSNLDALDKSESRIRRLQVICQIEKRVIEHRSRILAAQRKIIDVNKTLIEIKSRLRELSNM